MRAIAGVVIAVAVGGACMKAKKDEKTGTGSGSVAGSGSESETGSGSGTGSAAPAGNAVAVTDEASAKAAVGKVVRVEGTAENAKLAAVVAIGDFEVYCWDRKDGWDDTGGKVAVEGMLEYTDE